ncbi:hypothetical protein ACJ6WF_17155 [Streptomyces sp. MMS24-I2-30]|uniref:hypothetical protein n=1 Tax=Streptomyces sp. MMS24-I2-30 TaxID=3351564 RepID=UPI003896A7F3
MASEPVVVEFDDPIGATVRLPGLGGAIQGAVVAVEIRPNGEFWLRVKVEMWCRWRTQLRVGSASLEGVGPEKIEMWAPSFSVSIDSERGPEVVKILRSAQASA